MFSNFMTNNSSQRQNSCKSLQQIFSPNTDLLMKCHEAKGRDERVRGPQVQRYLPKKPPKKPKTKTESFPCLLLVEETKQTKMMLA